MNPSYPTDSPESRLFRPRFAFIERTGFALNRRTVVSSGT